MNKDRQIQQRVKRAFDRQALDDAASAALRTARERALDHASASSMPGWLPKGAIALFVMVVAGVMLYRVNESNPLPPMTAEEIAVITSEEELELFEELEFYIWLEEEENA